MRVCRCGVRFCVIYVGGDVLLILQKLLGDDDHLKLKARFDGEVKLRLEAQDEVKVVEMRAESLMVYSRVPV